MVGATSVSHASVCPAPVLDARLRKPGMVGTFAQAQRPGLNFLPKSVLPQRVRRVEEKLTLVRKAFEGGESAIRGTIAVGPIVIAGGKDGRRDQRIEIE